MTETIALITGVFILGTIFGFVVCALFSINKIDGGAEEDRARLDFLIERKANIAMMLQHDHWAILWGDPMEPKMVGENLRVTIDRARETN